MRRLLTSTAVAVVLFGAASAMGQTPVVTEKPQDTDCSDKYATAMVNCAHYSEQSSDNNRLKWYLKAVTLEPDGSEEAALAVAWQYELYLKDYWQAYIWWDITAAMIAANIQHNNSSNYSDNKFEIMHREAAKKELLKTDANVAEAQRMADEWKQAHAAMFARGHFEEKQ